MGYLLVVRIVRLNVFIGIVAVVAAHPQLWSMWISFSVSQRAGKVPFLLYHHVGEESPLLFLYHEFPEEDDSMRGISSC